MDQTPITLPQRSSLQLVMSLFQKLGLRYILFSTHGQLQGLLTKKDAAFAMNSDGGDVAGDVDGARIRVVQNNAHSGQERSLLGELRGEEQDDDDDGRSTYSSDPLTSL